MSRISRSWFLALNLALATGVSFLVGKVCADPGPPPPAPPECFGCTCRDVEAYANLTAQDVLENSKVYFYQDELGTNALSTHAWTEMHSAKDKCQGGVPTAKSATIFVATNYCDPVCMFPLLNPPGFPVKVETTAVLPDDPDLFPAIQRSICE